jgi:hypothetical protein
MEHQVFLDDRLHERRGTLDRARAQALSRGSLRLFHGYITTGRDVFRSLLYLAEALAEAGDPSKVQHTALDALHRATVAHAVSRAHDALPRPGWRDRMDDVSLTLRLELRRRPPKGENPRTQLAAQLAPQQLETASTAANRRTLGEILITEQRSAAQCAYRPAVDTHCEPCWT